MFAKASMTTMAEKSFADMSLEEVFELETKNPPFLGRSVVTASGLKRSSRQLSKTIKEMMESEKKRRKKSLLVSR